ncbi:MAG: transposase [Balneolaceae bacterium]|nr:transposase [Balneolaceae bacterium]MCH8547308.1 transposase [Balneolaceae bacterium]
MSQSLTKIYVHTTFSTKGRKPMICKSFQSGLHAYMAGLFKKVDCPALIINSVPDHIHILHRLSKNVAIADAIEHVKKYSSSWAKENGDNDEFYWQRGYGAFSVSSSGINSVRRYIARQEEHHKVFSYREEIE